MKIATFNLTDAELATIRRSSGDDEVVSCSHLEDLVSVDGSTLCVINGKSFRAELHELLSQSPDFKTRRKIIIVDGPEEELYFSKTLCPDMVFLRTPVIEQSLTIQIEHHREVEELKSRLQEKETSESRYDTIFSQSPIGIMVTDDAEALVHGTFKQFSVNPMVERIMGRTKEELGDLGLADITYPDDLQEDMTNLRKLIAKEIDGYAMDKRYIRPDGSAIWVHIEVAPISMPKENKHLQVCFIFDITKRVQLETALSESERSRSVLLSHLPGMAYRCDNDRDWTMRYISAGCLGLTGYKPEEIIDNKVLSFNEIIAPEYRKQLWKSWSRVLAKHKPFKDEYEIITAHGERKWVMEAAQGVYDSHGNVEALEGIILDITERKKFEQQLIDYNEHDQWTGLLNRRAFEKLLQHEAASRSKAKRAIVGINLSTIHALSTTYGFDYSQKVVKRISDEFKRISDDNHMLFNTYVNRFVFYIKSYQDKEELIDFCEDVSKRLSDILTIERIGWGIGIIELHKFYKRDINKVLRNLLVASERSLFGFGDDLNYWFFDNDMEMAIEREKEITQELSEISSCRDEERLFLQFQPIVELGTGAICGFEALARLHSSQFGTVPPMEFIPIAEKTKIIIPLGRLILRQAFQFQKRLRAAGYTGVSVSINISPLQLFKRGFVSDLVALGKESEVDPHLVSLEITESILVSNFQEVNSVLRQLREIGFQIALDDFGTGYSSFARERELQINCLKIDKSFIDRLMDLDEHLAITGDIISMAHKMGHCVVAEGVEHEEQLQYLKRHGCDMIQGYLISKPVHEDDAITMLAKQTAVPCCCH